MPTKTFVGTSVSTLLHQAQSTIGPDAVVMHVRRFRTKDGERFEVTAADPATAMRGPTAGRTPVTAALELLTPPQPSTGILSIALVGPTGGGKTTTIAKLASNPRIFGARRVGLVGLDTFRIGAIEQLRTYADLGGLPCAVVYGEDDLIQMRRTLAGTVVWLIDTPGRSLRARRDREDADRLLETLSPTEVHLVVPAYLSEHLVRAVIRETRTTRVTHLLVTKIDEAPDEAAVFEVAVELGLPIRWVTDGQDVPYDVSGADDPMASVRAVRLTSDQPTSGGAAR